ncbi:MAG: DNA alkylation repair protein [Lachnospiraceae bacterium]|nr:DNA alkylation repair protein [Lachnospiraceae bacterium]
MMNSIILKARNEINLLAKNVPQGKHIVTTDIRKLSGKLYRTLDNHNKEVVFALCEELLEQRNWESGVIAFDWAYRVRDQYNEDTYFVFYKWLKKYVRGWGDCDDFCTHAFGALIKSRKYLFGEVLKWTGDDDFWVRRASAVVLIPAILHNDYEGIRPFLISDALMFDQHDLVQKGYGWMLKSLSTVDYENVRNYLVDKHSLMPRTAFRYALEKFDEKTRKRLMEL